MLAEAVLPQLEQVIDAADVRAALGLSPDAHWQAQFLAQGEYNINYLLRIDDGRRLVARVNVGGTQIGMAGGAQIAYEAVAMRAVGASGVAPRLVYVDDTLARLPYGWLMMEYVPGSPLHYADPRHLVAAARTLAGLHRVRIPDDAPFIRRRTPHGDVVEAQGWLANYLACARAPVECRDRFARLLDRAAIAAERCGDRFPAPTGLVHTDAQAHNFIVNERADDRGDAALDCWLVDWERPLVDDPTYDLAHFLIPTTTRWKCDYEFSVAERAAFLDAYCAARPDLDAADLRERLHLRYPFILLRAVSWCASAWVEYTGAGRAIANNDTLVRIEEYLRPEYLDALFAEWLA